MMHVSFVFHGSIGFFALKNPCVEYSSGNVKLLLISTVLISIYRLQLTAVALEK